MEYKGVYISLTPDCGPNEGGYYCQVYKDEDMNCQIDDFCIHSDELCANPDVDHWIRVNVDGILDWLDLEAKQEKRSLSEQIQSAVARTVESNSVEKASVEKIKMKAVDIIWDTDGEDVMLPTEIELPAGMNDVDEISDYISDKTGYCHCGFKVEKIISHDKAKSFDVDR